MAIRPSAVVATVRRVLLVAGVAALCGVLLAGLALPVVAGLGLTARESADTFAAMPADLEPGPMAQTSYMYDADGAQLATFFEENRVEVGLDAIAPVMKDAILAIEDDRFYERGPIDIQGTLRALLRNVEAGETQGGGSTLTQQYVKQVRVSQATTPEEVAEVQASTGTEGYRRKLEELRMAVQVEQELSKDEILQRYLNIAFFGSRSYGIEAAARTYFSTSAAELTLPQAALLAGIVQQPVAYDPTNDPEAALGRRNVVLNRMAATGRITEQEAAEARQTDLGLNLSATPNGCVASYAGYFCDYVRRELLTMPELGETRQEREAMLERGGLRVETTISPSAQQAAQAAVSDRVAPTDSVIGSLATVQPNNGYIRAMANSRNFGVEGDGVSNLNYAVDEVMGGGSGIQSGSTFKTFVLAAAIDQGIPLNTSINSPQQVNLRVNSFSTCDGRIRSSETWSPKNSTGSGTFNLRTGTERSVNTFFAQLEQRTGLCLPATIAQGAGVMRADLDEDGAVQPLSQVPSFTLGANEVSPLSMAAGYAMFANRGAHCPTTSVARVLDSEGNVLVDHTQPTCEQVVKPEVADAVNSVLQGVVHNSGATGNRMRLDDGRIAAGKTGTTNGAIAVWFVGYTPQLSTAVAVADVEAPQQSLDGRTYNGERIGEACGGCIPGPIWKTMMDRALDGAEKVNFTAPDPETIRGVTVPVPDVRGMGTDEAIQTLQEAGFSASVAGEVNSDLQEGLVVSTEPGAGAEVGSGSSIAITVSNGEPEEPSNEPTIGIPTEPPNFGDEDGEGGGEDGWRDGFSPGELLPGELLPAN
ncbi:transglycosylase domain-containing protein [Jiangella sp. DSM 45060]|uniref:transglycosylase domain-containing protein n=1 Tax=Jiangella sp. DSM 45060 TaxID=1798224 RepID=UPI00087A6C47|nr:transglycosylase domain-containing protein [Jiangella sp. DSM 45060]SDT71096.1 Membrane carboxypeptidase (penicillin-binding protein) [Jiangella sp. DSM 45060]